MWCMLGIFSISFLLLFFFCFVISPFDFVLYTVSCHLLEICFHFHAVALNIWLKDCFHCLLPFCPITPKANNKIYHIRISYCESHFLCTQEKQEWYIFVQRCCFPLEFSLVASFVSSLMLHITEKSYKIGSIHNTIHITFMFK